MDRKRKGEDGKGNCVEEEQLTREGREQRNGVKAKKGRDKENVMKKR